MFLGFLQISNHDQPVFSMLSVLVNVLNIRTALRNFFFVFKKYYLHGLILEVKGQNNITPLDQRNQD